MRPPTGSPRKGSSTSDATGSARKGSTASAASTASEAAGSTNWLRSIRFSGFTVLMFVVLVLFVVIVAPGARVFIEQRPQIADLQNSLQSEQAQNSTLTTQIARWSDPA